MYYHFEKCRVMKICGNVQITHSMAKKSVIRQNIQYVITYKGQERPQVTFKTSTMDILITMRICGYNLHKNSRH